MAVMLPFRCAQCGEPGEKSSSHVNRSAKIGAPLYCGRECSALARRTDTRTPEQRVTDKRAYDMEYRAKNRSGLKAKHAAWYARYGPENREKERTKRAANMNRHVEYCRKPEYRKKKQSYDERRRSRIYGPFAECHRLLVELKKEIVARLPNYYDRHSETIKARAARQKRKRSRG